MTPIEQRIREAAERIVSQVSGQTRATLASMIETELLAFRQAALEEAARITEQASPRTDLGQFIRRLASPAPKEEGS